MIWLIIWYTIGLLATLYPLVYDYYHGEDNIIDLPSVVLILIISLLGIFMVIFVYMIIYEKKFPEGRGFTIKGRKNG